MKCNVLLSIIGAAILMKAPLTRMVPTLRDMKLTVTVWTLLKFPDGFSLYEHPDR